MIGRGHPKWVVLLRMMGTHCAMMMIVAKGLESVVTDSPSSGTFHSKSQHSMTVPAFANRSNVAEVPQFAEGLNNVVLRANEYGEVLTLLDANTSSFLCLNSSWTEYLQQTTMMACYIIHQIPKK